MAKEYSREIANAVNQFLVDDDWKFSFDEERGLFKFGISLKSKLKSVDYIIDIKEQSYLVYTVSPIGATADNREEMATMAEFLNRANYGLRNGNFELDMDDGEIRYKCFVDCENRIPSKDIVENSIYCPPFMFERYAPGIIGIIFGGMSAKQAIDLCENDQ